MTSLAMARQLVARAALEQPRAVELACLAAFAVRVDPSLLRRLRVELMPGSTPDLEAEVWQGEFVSFRGPEGFVFAPGVGSALRERLATQPTRYEAAWRLTEEAHRALASTLLLEEELQYLQFCPAPEAAARARDRLRSAVAALVKSETPDLARWAVGAITRLPSDQMEGEEGQMLKVAAQTRLRGSLLPLEAPPGPLNGWMAWLAPSDLERVRFAVRLFPGSVELAPAQGNEDSLIEVPRTAPLVVEVTGDIEEIAPESRWRMSLLASTHDHPLALQLDREFKANASLQVIRTPTYLMENFRWPSAGAQKQHGEQEAVVLLLSEAALHSTEFRAEVQNTVMNKLLGEDLILLPVYLGWETSYDLARDWPELGQRHSVQGITAVPSEEPHHLAKRIFETLQLQAITDTGVTWRRIEFQPSQPLRLPMQAGHLRLRTLAGDEYFIGPDEPATLLRMPAPREDLFGYDPEFHALLEAYAQGHRFFVIQGPEGAGKTQFALRVAARLAPEFAQESLYVEQRPGEPRFTAASVARQVAQSLVPEFPPRKRDPITRYHEVLANRRVLMVVDGLSELPGAVGDAVPEFDALRPESGSVLILVTQQAPPKTLAWTLELKGLDPESASRLLYRVAPDLREQVHAVAEACHYLPGTLLGIGRALADLRGDLLPSAGDKQLERALEAMSLPDSIKLRRVLAQRNPDAFLPSLAMSLSNLGVQLSEMGRREEALAVAEEAIDIIWPFFERLPPAFEQNTATILRRVLKLHELLQRPLSSKLQEHIATFNRLKESMEFIRPEAGIPAPSAPPKRTMKRGAQQDRVVILTALSVESQAVRAHLTELHQQVLGEGSIYERGQFISKDRSWEVLLVKTGDQSPIAVVETERALQYFKPSVALVVGIAGGLQNVAIGDVVVATQVFGYEANQERNAFELRPEVIASSDALMSRAQAAAKSAHWLERIPGLTARTPRVFLGPIATGTEVLANASSELALFLKNHNRKTLALEMEGLGLHMAAHANRNVSALVIRGICDLIDGEHATDNSGAQQLAARNAAAFAFELLAKY